MEPEAFTLWDGTGHRLYLTPEERERFRGVARSQGDRETRTFCQLLALTGCRISEGLEVTPQRIDWQDRAVVFRTLKKRGPKKDSSFRAVPLPPDFLDELDLVHHLTGKGRVSPALPLWSWHRATAWRHVKGVMDAAGIEGPQATAKGLRHGFGVAHALNKTPLPLLQRWMGHSTPQTTAIYMQATGEEERQLAAAVW